ncbi:hypothetical protein Tco_1013536 [Tanacetum coccineum]
MFPIWRKAPRVPCRPPSHRSPVDTATPEVQEGDKWGGILEYKGGMWQSLNSEGEKSVLLCLVRILPPIEAPELDDKLHFIEESIEVMDREVKQLKQSHIPIVKVRWNSKRGPEFTWEREDQFRSKYPHLFPNTPPADGTN